MAGDDFTFTVRIDTVNAAFGEHVHDAGPELARILREIADRVEAGTYDGTARDYNGNTVAAFGFGGVA